MSYVIKDGIKHRYGVSLNSSQVLKLCDEVIPRICANCEFYNGECCFALGKEVEVNEPYFHTCNEFGFSFYAFEDFCKFLTTVGYADDM